MNFNGIVFYPAPWLVKRETSTLKRVLKNGTVKKYIYVREVASDEFVFDKYRFTMYFHPDYAREVERAVIAAFPEKPRFIWS